MLVFAILNRDVLVMNNRAVDAMGVFIFQDGGVNEDNIRFGSVSSTHCPVWRPFALLDGLVSH